MYRPLPLASFAMSWTIAGAHRVLLHAMNLLWHAAMAVAVAALAGRLADVTVAFVAGLIFAVHPVHVEAIANVIGLGELMAAAGVCLAVYAAAVRQDVVWSGLALLLGLLSKENAVVAPALILWAWIGGPRPLPRRMLTFAMSWLIIGGAYLAVRGIVLHPYARLHAIAPVFLGESFFAGRLTAVAAPSPVNPPLPLPPTLSVDYPPAPRAAVRAGVGGAVAVGFAGLPPFGLLLGLRLGGG